MILVLLLVISVTTFSHAATEVSPGNKKSDEPIKTKAATGGENKSRSELLVGPNEKMMRGAKNLFFGWTEIPKCIVSTTNESNPIKGLFFGSLKGLRKAFPKTVSGAADVLTFPVGGYEKPVISPDPLAE
ncbi:exosortase system-associated protein, TIGR04073 family [Candidatus Omnitrophota bacterium]